MEEANSIAKFKDQLKRLPQSMATHKQLHDLETRRAKRLNVQYRSGVKKCLDRLKKTN